MIVPDQNHHNRMSAVEEESSSSSVIQEHKHVNYNENRVAKSALSMDIAELGSYLGGTGRAKIAWDLYRLGIDPQLYFSEDLRGA